MTFSFFPMSLRKCVARLMVNAFLALLFVCFVPLVHAQTLADVQTLMNEGKLPQALEQIDRYLSTRPRDAQGLFTKGVILSEMEHLQDAIQVFQDLTGEFPDLPKPYNNLGVLYARQGQYDKALEALEKAVQAHPDYAIAHENIGDIYTRLANQTYDKAFELDSGNGRARDKQEITRKLIEQSIEEQKKK